MNELYKKSIAGSALCVLALAAQLSGCGKQDTSTSADRQRIAELELELSKLKAASPVAPPVAATASAEQAAAEKAAPVPETAPAEVVGKQWEYTVSEEKMTGGKTKFASVSSTNTVEFGFPYGGTQHGSLTLRTDPRHGKDVMFQIQRGQILCPSYQGCSVQVRFDDEKPVTYSAGGPSDNSTETIFIQAYSGFLNKLKKARRVRVSVDIYQQGSPVFEFDVSGFDLARYQGQ